MRAVPVDQAVAAAELLVEDEVLAHQANGLDRIGVELAGAADRHPVAPQIVAHRRAGANLGEDIVLFSAEHCGASFSSPIRLARSCSRSRASYRKQVPSFPSGRRSPSAG